MNAGFLKLAYLPLHKHLSPDAVQALGLFQGQGHKAAAKACRHDDGIVHPERGKRRIPFSSQVVAFDSKEAVCTELFHGGKNCVRSKPGSCSKFFQGEPWLLFAGTKNSKLVF